MIIRSAKIEDLQTLLDFEQKIIETERPMDSTLKSDEKISYYDIKSYIITNDVEVVVAETEQEVVASGYGKIKNRKDYFIQKQLGYIGFMYVKETYRGQGISQKILQALFDWFKTKNIEEIRLDVYDKNPRAIRAYEKAGFDKHLTQMRINLNDINKTL